MKLWKKFNISEKSENKQDSTKEILSLKPLKFINNTKLNLDDKKFKSKKSLKSLSKSYSSSSLDLGGDETEKSKRHLKDIDKKKIKINLADKKFDDMRIISTTLSSDFFGNKKRNMRISNMKTMYPTLPNNKIKNKTFNIKLKKIQKKKSPPNYNSNSILNRWTDDINKLFTQSLKKAKKEMVQILRSHKLRSIQKKFKTRNITNFNKVTNENNNEMINSINTFKTKSGQNNDLEISTPLNNIYNTYANYSRQKENTNSEHNTKSNVSSKSNNKNENDENKKNNNNNINNNKENEKNYQRKINYRNYIKDENILNTKWKKKLGILNLEIKYGGSLLSDLGFQYSTIRDEINLISDGIHYFKISLFGKEDLLNAFNNKDLYSQIHINKTLEETCALLSLIPKIILKEYYMYCDKFISFPEPKREFLYSRVINNEMDCFKENIILLYKISSFIKATFEVYIQLVNQVDEEMIISKNDFEILKAIFEKCRYYVGNLINFANNMLKDYNFDKKLIKRGKPILNNIKERLKDERKLSIDDLNFYRKSENKKEEKNKYFMPRRLKKDYLNIISNNLNLQNDEYLQKIIRIRNALDNSEIKTFTDDMRLKKLGLNVGKPMALIFSPLMTRMLKYIKKDYREKIIALRSTEKFFPFKKDEEYK
jgi:hypothetical protein